MTDNIMTLVDYLRKAGLQENLDFFRKAAEYFGQKVIDIEAEEVIGAKKYERAGIRLMRLAKRQCVLHTADAA